MTELVPIRVKIGLKQNGHADYPDWALLPMVDETGNTRPFAPHGWMYDKQSGHQEQRSGGFWDSPQGMQWGCLLVTAEFADAAVAQFPTVVDEINETQLEEFYNGCVTLHIPETEADTLVVQGYDAELRLRESLGENTTALKAKITRSLDPDDPTEPGIKKNKNKKWADAKVNKGIEIKKGRSKK